MTSATDILARVRQVELRTRKQANDLMAGAYYSQFKGRGMDFEELREYVPGDDVRTIDWNVTARMRRPFVKLHREERELAVLLVLDISASGDFGSSGQTKREYAAEVAATLAYSALRNGDKVGLLLFTDRVELFLPPKKGRKHFLRVIREAIGFRPVKRGTDIRAALAFLNHVTHRRAIVFLLTDFLHTAGQKDGELSTEIGRTHARHDMICIHITDPRERALPPAGLLTIEDAETGEHLEVDTTRVSIREAFAESANGRLETLDRSLAHTGVDLLRLTPGTAHASVLQRFFEQRRR
jgi:uncharacterized protein (DUF58 family)